MKGQVRKMIFSDKSRAFSSAMLFITIAILSFSCKKEESIIGLEVQPPSEQVDVLFTDTCSIQSYTIREDSLITNATIYNLLGSMNDSVFGKTNASFYTQVGLATSNVSFGDAANITIDSVVLALKYNSYYGNLTPQTFKVFEITEDILNTQTYYSNVNVAYNAAELGRIDNVTPNLTDSLHVGSDTIAPHLRIKLDNSLGQRFIDADASVFANNASFLSFFKGFYITTENSSQQIAEGAILYFDLKDPVSKFTVYYRDSIAHEFDFVIDGNAIRINKFEHDYSGTPVGNQLSNSLLGRERVYVQSMSGVKTKIYFPFLKELKSLNNIAINKAELILPVERNDELDPHSKLILAASDADGKPVSLIDAVEGANYFGGIYDSTAREYRFNIARHLHQIIYEDSIDYGLFIMSSGGVINANRTIIKGGNPYNTMKLKITYTEL